MTRGPDHSPELQQALEQYREAQSPDAAVRDRVWAGVDGSVGPPSATGSDAPVAPSGGIGGGAKLLMLGGALVMGGALWLLTTSPSGLGVAPPSSASPRPAVTAPNEAQPSNAVARPVEPAPPPQPVVAAVEALPGPDSLAPAEVAPEVEPPRPSGRAASGSSSAPASTLSAELKLMTAAQSALEAGQARRALRLLERHRRRFASGALAEEREAARVETLCRLGRHAAARRAAERFANRFVGSPRIARVTATCAEARP